MLNNISYKRKIGKNRMT